MRGPSNGLALGRKPWSGSYPAASASPDEGLFLWTSSAVRARKLMGDPGRTQDTGAGHRAERMVRSGVVKKMKASECRTEEFSELSLWKAVPFSYDSVHAPECARPLLLTILSVCASDPLAFGCSLAQRSRPTNHR